MYEYAKDLTGVYHCINEREESIGATPALTDLTVSWDE